MHAVGVRDLLDLEAERRRDATDATDASDEAEPFEIIQGRADGLPAAPGEVRQPFEAREYATGASAITLPGRMRMKSGPSLSRCSYSASSSSALVRQMRRRRPKGGRMSLREISAELAARGFMNERGNAYSATSINSMIKQLSATP
jgi:hypothetical protein